MICARGKREPDSTYHEITLFGPLLTQYGTGQPYSEESNLLIGGSFSSEKTQIETSKSAHSGTKTVDWRIVLLKQNDPVIISYLV